MKLFSEKPTIRTDHLSEKIYKFSSVLVELTKKHNTFCWSYAVSLATTRIAILFANDMICFAFEPYCWYILFK